MPFIQIQFFLSLLSLPVLIAWGLPFSIMTIIGNLIFAPFLTIFLLCSSLIFFTELLHIPNAFLIWILEAVSSLWIWCLQWSSKSWMIGFKISTLPLSILIALLAIMILQHTRLGKKDMSGLLYVLLFFSLLLANKLMSSPSQATITCNKKTVTIYRTHNKLTLIDNGALGEKINPTSWIAYTLLNKLTKTFGTFSIKNVFIKRCKLPTLDALATLCDETIVDGITFTYPQEISRKSERHIKKIMKCCKCIKTLYKKPIMLNSAI
jgi:hypothetical protein